MKILQNLQNLKEEDHRRALYASLVFIMLMILFFLLVSLEEPDPPLQEEIIEISMPDIEIIEEGSQSEGGSNMNDGSPDTETNDVQESVQDIATQDDSPVVMDDGNGEGNNTSQESNEPQADQSLGFPGNGGGDGTGEGTEFGAGEGVGGDGVGNTPGNGTYNPNRKLIKNPVFDAQAQEQGKIALDIWVDSNGKVVKMRIKESKSTSGSAYLINLAKKAAATMRYDTKSGAGWEHVGYKVFNFIKA